MKRLSPQHRDLISVILLVAILVIAFPLLGSWLSERVAAPVTPTPTATAPKSPAPTPEPTKESRATEIGARICLAEMPFHWQNTTCLLSTGKPIHQPRFVQATASI